MALFECVISCSEWKSAVPPWARDALAEKFKPYLDGERLQIAMLGRRRGRQADPRTEARDHDDDAVALGALLAAERIGLRGEAKYNCAQALLLRARKPVVSPERLRQLKQLHRKTPVRGAMWESAFLEQIAKAENEQSQRLGSKRR